MKILEDVEDGEGDEALRFRCSECRAAFLRGMFLGCGRLTDPAKHYLLEFSVGERADFAEKFLWSCDLTPKCTVRRSETILFLSHASAVEEFLVLAGLNSYAFSLMNARISHDMATQTIRITNCEMGNLNRSVTAAVKQTEAMRVLIEADKLGLLPPELQETVRARLAHPEMSLASLAATFSPPLTKSGLAHRLSKIESVAVRLLEEK